MFPLAACLRHVGLYFKRQNTGWKVALRHYRASYSPKWTESDNQKVKLFSKSMRFLSSVSVSGWPWDITMMNDSEAVVTEGWSLVFLKVTERQLRIKRTVQLSYYCYGITYSNYKLIVTDRTTIHALDLGGRELWTVEKALYDGA